MNEKQPDVIDQTDFSEIAPITEDNSTPIAPSITPEPDETVKKPIKKPIPLPFLLAGILGVILLVALVAISLTPKTNNQTQTNPTASATPVTQSNLPPDLQKAISTLKDDIKDADPQANDLPFPPVNFQLHLVAPAATITQ